MFLYITKVQVVAIFLQNFSITRTLLKQKISVSSVATTEDNLKDWLIDSETKSTLLSQMLWLETFKWIHCNGLTNIYVNNMDNLRIYVLKCNVSFIGNWN